MAARRKVTPVQRGEIRRRRAAGESLLSIGERIGLPHQTVSRVHREDRKREAKEKAQAAAERERRVSLEAEWGRWVVSFEPRRRGPIFHSPEQRLAYYAQRVAESFPDRLNYNDACSGILLKAAMSAMASGRPFFLYPPGVAPPPAAA